MMRVYGSTGATPGATAYAARRSRPGSFSLPETFSAPEARPMSAPRAPASIDALIALQGVTFDDQAERRKRALRQGRSALDVLEDLKMGLLSGKLDSSMVGRLKKAANELKTLSGDPGLDGVLAEIELRVEVELAKVARL